MKAEITSEIQDGQPTQHTAAFIDCLLAQMVSPSRQLCCECGEPTVRSAEDVIRRDGLGPLCDDCAARMI